MPVAITVRNVPDEVRNELASRAARAGQSLQEYLRAELIDRATRPAPTDVMAKIRSRVEGTGVRLDRGSLLEDVHDGRR